MPIRVPTEAFLTKGVGVHEEKLTSFEYALRDAGIAAYNLVKVSSIFPPNAKLVAREKGVEKLRKYVGGIVHCVLSESATEEPHRLIAAANGIAIPKHRDRHGYISEHHSYGQTAKEAGDYAEDVAVEMLGSTLGLEVDVNKAYNELRDFYRLSGEIIKTSSVVQSATGKKTKWTTVVSAVVFCDYK
ncbi:arginine decarboxylase, pyruvoyl-dependent [Candidatus Woesearchaeota archaeon]|nr:arginine decarboxylase, pyruvoyl-dependent [Candidatus Woesearchaeota archaeon]